MFRHRDAYPQGVFKFKGIQAQHAITGVWRTHWNGLFFWGGAQQPPSGPGPPHSRGF